MIDKIKENLKDMIYFQDERERNAYFEELEAAVKDAGVDAEDDKAVTEVANKLAADKGLTYAPKED